MSQKLSISETLIKISFYWNHKDSIKQTELIELLPPLQHYQQQFQPILPQLERFIQAFAYPLN